MKEFHDFNPYDLLIEMQARLDRLELAHNKLAHAFQKTEHELTELLKMFNHLQKSHLAMSQLISVAAINQWNLTPDELKSAEQSFKK
jgi:predicted nuclease with TOPRIM domain